MKQHRKCFIMRGYAGSGKSTKALEIKSQNESTEIVSADLFSGFSDSYVVKMMGNLVVVMLVFGAYFSCCLKATARGKRNWNTWLFPMR